MVPGWGPAVLTELGSLAKSWQAEEDMEVAEVDVEVDAEVVEEKEEEEAEEEKEEAEEEEEEEEKNNSDKI